MNASGNETIQGTLSRIRFHKPETGFLIGSMQDGSVVVGTIRAPQEGAVYTLQGAWSTHPRFGRQFKFTDHAVEIPKDADAVRVYVEKNAPGFGPRMAASLVQRFGADAVTILREDPEKVAREVSGIGVAAARRAAGALALRARLEGVEIALTKLVDGIRVPRRFVAEMLDRYGADALAVARENPYALADTFGGIGFPTADAIARRCGIDASAPMRIRAGLTHVIHEAAFSGGHTRVRQEAAVSKAVALLGCVASEARDAMAAAVRDGALVVDDDGADSYVSLRRLRDAERSIAQRLAAMIRRDARPIRGDTTGLADDQVVAVESAMRSNVFVLTGGPGTGKTFTICKLIESFEAARPDAKIALAAPTGKAAKRISEQTGRDASTIHRLLEPIVNGGVFTFSYCGSNPLPHDLIVVDECSMVDAPLMTSFLSAVTPATRLILVGDTDQLPSVGPGSVLGDIIASGCVESVRLTKIKRQDPGGIVTNCHRVREGSPVLPRRSDGGAWRDFFIIECDDEATIHDKVVELATERLPRAMDADALRDIQVITATRTRTRVSCEGLNASLQKILNPPRLDDEGAAPRIRIGDKVIQRRNDYDLGIINGDIGYVAGVDRGGDKKLVVAFDNPSREVKIPAFGNDLDLAYALTCHSFQGSEARIVVIPIYRGFGTMMLQRNWLYTAMSRARELCVLVGQRAEIDAAARRSDQRRRETGLHDALLVAMSEREAA